MSPTRVETPNPTRPETRAKLFEGSYNVLTSQFDGIATTDVVDLREPEEGKLAGQVRPEQPGSGKQLEEVEVAADPAGRFLCVIDGRKFEVRRFVNGEARLLLAKPLDGGGRPEVDIWVAEDEGKVQGERY